MTEQDKKHETFFRDILIFFTVAIAVLLCAAWLTSCKPKDVIPESVVVTSNKAIIAQKDSIIAVKDSIIAQLTRKSTGSESKQSDISKSFKPVYDKINNDTGIVNQWNYLQVLLSEADRAYSSEN